MTKPGRRWLLVAGAMLLVCILARAPAALWVYGAQAALPGFTVTAVEGSIWRGQAQGLAWQWQSQAMGLSRLRWQLTPWSLLLLSPAVEVDANLHEQQFQGHISAPLGQSLRLREFTIVMPASQLPVQAPLPVSARVSVDIARLSVDERAISELEGRVALEGVQVHGQRKWALGSFAAELFAAQGDLHARLFDLGGPGRLAGEMQVATSGAYRLDTSLGLEAYQEDGLASVLALLGESGEEGQVRIRREGQLW